MTTKKLFLGKKKLKTKITTATTTRLFEPARKKKKTPIENDTLEEFNTIEFFYNNNKLIDENTINPKNLVPSKCYIKYWRHFTSK
jgi:hypothetical protein